MPDTLHALTLTGTYHGQTIQNVIHFKNLDGVGSNQFLCEDFRDNLITPWRLLVHDSFQFNSLEAVQIRSLTPMPAHIEPLAQTGQGGVTQSHSVTCFKIRKRTTRGGRRGFGKIYVGGVAANLFDGNYVIGETGTQRLLVVMSGLESRYCDGVPGQPFFRMVLIHKDANDPPNDVNGFTIYPVAGVQRRRNRLTGL